MSAPGSLPTTPPQVAPIRRTEVTQPHESVDLEHGDTEQMVRLRMAIMHGANHNDPAAWGLPSYGDRSVRR